MEISSTPAIGFNAPTRNNPAAPPASSAASQSSSPSPATGTDPEQTFLDYMNKPLAERMEDAWLASHHLTKKDLEAMSPEKRKAIEQQMAEEIKTKLKQDTAKKTGANIDISI